MTEKKQIVTLTIDLLMKETELQLFQTMYSQQIEAITLISDRQEETSLFVEHAEIETTTI
ncbi:hypothetical protein [Lysinibacillus xylanilyticus]|uniref:hypothetical protein n=1 Tax=Lysinibacillus xylanilyticus TaxID=582475 RepID=UPI00083C955F|nr:hypothetical protein [Lysinibacillus xylanilyticus]